MKVLLLLKGKLLLTVASVVLVAGGTTAVLAATPAGQAVVQSITHTKPTVTAEATHTDHDSSKTPDEDKDKSACPGLEDAQNLAEDYHLSTSAQGNAVKAFCALHQGTFKGTTTSGSAVTTTRAYGYGEVNQLLTYAQYLAAHSSTGTKLTDANVSGYLADALHSCGTTRLDSCLKAKIPGYQPGKGNDDHENDNKDDNKPAATSTPNGKKPTVTPTPHA
jgi:hypothetical protein